MKLILATWNTAKFKWLFDGFSKTDLPIVTINKKIIQDIEENGANCSENALIKVRAIGPLKNSIIIGEDSGLFIDALDGFPGVKTARWMDGTDDDRSMRILEKMKNYPQHQRIARFISSIALLLPDGKEKVFTGYLEGTISSELKGEPGKGYQRIFILKIGKSIAESESKTILKNDHRYQSIEKSVDYILNL